MGGGGPGVPQLQTPRSPKTRGLAVGRGGLGGRKGGAYGE